MWLPENAKVTCVFGHRTRAAPIRFYAKSQFSTAANSNS